MERCDVLIVGGGPAGSACAWKLRQAGFDVLVLDRATFPRDKVCAGWITPQVIEDLNLDLEDYRSRRTLQPITGFRVGIIGDERTVAVAYDRPISFGIRRCEFDHYLLERSRARLSLGAPVSTIRRDRREWVINEQVRAPVLVGAGGHFCPVARMLNEPSDAAPVVIAQETEFQVASNHAERFTTRAEMPELYFCADLKGYGWCFRKQDHLNVGLGRLDRRTFPSAAESFVQDLKSRGTVPRDASWRWRGHAYLLVKPRHRRLVDEGVLLVGDAAGLAYAESGEGIRPAIESGLLAAAAIVECGRVYSAQRLSAYETRLHERGVSTATARTAPESPSGIALACATRLLRVPWFVRHIVLDRWFLRRSDRAIA